MEQDLSQQLTMNERGEEIGITHLSQPAFGNMKVGVR